jgi:hypothetical protein
MNMFTILYFFCVGLVGPLKLKNVEEQWGHPRPYPSIPGACGTSTHLSQVASMLMNGGNLGAIHRQ